MAMFFVLFIVHVSAWFVLGMLVGILHYKGGSGMKMSTATAIGVISFILHLGVKWILANGGFF